MIELFYILGIIIYIGGIGVFLHEETVENVKFHKGGFLGMGFVTYNNRDITPKDVRKSIIWPIILLFAILKGIICMVNDIIYFIGLLFGLYYNKTRFYKFIDEKFS